MADMKCNDNQGDEKHPMNVVENGDATLTITRPQKGCFISRIQVFAAVIIVVIAFLSIGLLAGLIGREHCTCTNETSVITSLITSTVPTRPTLDPSLPWSGIRLPRTLLPSSYHIILQVDLDKFIFNGSVDVTLTVTENTRYVVLHVNNLDIAKSKLAVFQEKSKRHLKIADTHIVPQNQFYVIETEQELQQGSRYVVRFGSFRGKLLGDLRGLYKSSYKTAQGITRYLATSQLQSVDARKVFPCFDEPDLKAVFTVVIIHKSEYEAIANMPRQTREVLYDGWVRDQFQPSPIMATYILAFVVADFRYRERKTPGGLTIRIWAQRDMYNQTAYALEFTEKAYAFFTDYFGIEEVMPKADHVAIPDFSAGAMENWGLVLYRETALLHDVAVSSIANKYWVSLVMAHEIAHTWFGNMVTMKWWDDLWLNEGFANTLMYFALNSIHTDWGVFDLQLVNNVWPVMTKDSLLTSHPISTPISDPDDIPQFFDSISYDKGMSVLRLLRGFLGWNDFQKGLQTYITKYQYGNAEMSELWQTFAEAVQHRYDVGEIMDTWTRQMGFPYVNLTRIPGTNRYLLKQQRFLLNPESTFDPNKSPYKYKWHIPFTYKYENHDEVRTQWMKMGSAEIDAPPSGKWLLCNVDYMGFYRTNYDPEMWRKISKQLLKNHLVFTVSNRAGLIDDAFNLARAGLLSYEIAFDLTSYLKDEDKFVPWRAFLDAMNFIRGMLATSDIYGKLQEYIKHLVADKHRTVGTGQDGTLLDRDLRRSMLKIAAAVGVKDAVEYGRNKFNHWMNTSEIPADYAVVIYAVGIREGGEEEWDFLWQKAQQSNVASESEIMMDALTHTREPWLLWRYARWSFDSDKIRMQDVRNLFSYFASTPLGRSVALQFLVTNWKEINKRFGMDVFLLRDIIYASTSLVNTDFEYNQLAQLYKDHPPVGVASKATGNSLALIRSNINWMKQHLKTISGWLVKRKLP